MMRAALKGLLANKLRLVLTGVAIVIGVGFVAASFVFTDTINAQFDVLLTDINAGVDVVVRPTEPEFGTEQLSMPEETLALVAGVDGVAIADPAVDGFAQVVGSDGEAIGGQGPPTIGVSWTGVAAFNPTTLVEGRGPQGEGEAVIDITTAETGNISVGDTITVLLIKAPQDFEVVGTISFGEDNALLGATLTGFDLAEAQRAFDLEGRLTTITVQSEPGVEPDELQQRIAAALPEGIDAITGEADTDEQLDEISQGLGFLTIALLAFAAVAVFVGAFIISNTFRIIVAQRTRELALFRAIGATGRQITLMVVVEALVIAVLASIVGVVFGVLLARGLYALLGALGIDIPSGSLSLLPRTVVVGMVVGVTVTLVSALLPARKAARVPPVAAMREEAARPKRRSLHTRAIVGIAVGAVGLLLLLVGLFVDVANALLMVGIGALIIFVGVSILAPLAARPMAKVLGWPLPRMFGVTGQLAQENTRRQPRRTAATASALMIGVALVVFVAVFAESIKETIEQSILNDFPADLSAQSTNFEVGLSPAFSVDVAELDEVDLVSPLQFGAIRVEETTGTSDTQLMGIDPTTIAEVYALEASPGALNALAGGGGVLVDPEHLADQDWSIGDTISIEYALTGPQQAEIIGTASGEAFGTNYWISTETYEQNFTARTDFIVFMNFTEGVAISEGKVAVETVAVNYANANVQTKSEVVAEAEAQINQLLGLVTGLLFLAIIVAMLGITNTLALSILERTREIGLLRAIGMQQRNVRRMIRWEAVIISLFGALLGIALGVFLGWAVVQSLADEGLGSFDIPWLQLIALVLLSGFVGVIAAIYPSYKASRLNILDAISYE